jgi:hypothetical protein
MTGPMFGLETEYAVTALDGAGVVLPRSVLIKQLMAKAVETLVHVPGGRDSGLFLANGCPFYIDAGDHPEIAAAECMNPFDAVRYAKAGDQIMWRLAEQVRHDHPGIAEILVGKGNVDYSGSGQSWGSHESYLHQVAPARLRRRLVPHLVSRVIYAGPGGFHPAADGVEFLLSPRSVFIAHPAANGTPGQRPLVDEREQPLGAGYFRQHLVCGESLQSDLAAFLRVGTTALVVALEDAGLGDERLALASPSRALAAIARDTSLRQTVSLRRGGKVTAIALQRRYLERACAHLHHPAMPTWAGAVCEIWDATLTRLEQGAEAVADSLDWAIKLAIYRDRVSRRGMTWGDRLLQRLGPELFEIDTRFGHLGPGGLFQTLDQAGALRHRVAGIDREDEAMDAPPMEGRARLRGEAIRRAARTGGSCVCEWDGLWDPLEGKHLNLADPFAVDPAWTSPEGSSATSDRSDWIAPLLHLTYHESPAVVRSAALTLRRALTAPAARPARLQAAGSAVDLNNRGVELRGDGRLGEAEDLIRAALAIDLDALGDDHPRIPHRLNNLAIVLIMRGALDDGRECLTRAWRLNSRGRDLTTGRILFVQFALATIAGEPTEKLLGPLKSHFAAGPPADLANVSRPWDIGCFVRHLRPLISDRDFELTEAIVEALDGQTGHQRLNELPAWRAVAAQPLDSQARASATR